MINKIEFKNVNKIFKTRRKTTTALKDINFEVKEKEADIVIKALSRLTINRRKVTVELAGEDRGGNNGRKNKNENAQKPQRKEKNECKHKSEKSGKDNFRQFFKDDDFWEDDSKWAKKKKKGKK